MTFIDDEVTPSLNGTGAEDYLNAGYGLGTPFAYLYNGAPHVIDPDKINGRACMYRWHADCPITFQKYFKHTIDTAKPTIARICTTRLRTGMRRRSPTIFRSCRR